MSMRWIAVGVCSLVLSSFSFANVANQRFAMWQVIDMKNGDAVAISDALKTNHKFSYHCVAEGNKCFYDLTVNFACKNNFGYPIIINTDVSTRMLVATCINLPTRKSVFFLETKKLDSLFESSSVASFSMPDNNANFENSSFALIGFVQSTDMTRSITGIAKQN